MAKAATSKRVTKKVVSKKKLSDKTVAKATKKAKPEKTERSIHIKYEDKSAGQPVELQEIFEAIKKMAEPYAGKKSFVLHASTAGQFNLVSHKPVVIAGRKKEELWFVSALIQKGYVGFYFMPIYMNDPMKKLFSPEFIKCLKGKACFHIKKKDPAIMAEIKKAIKIGYEAYDKYGWI